MRCAMVLAVLLSLGTTVLGVDQSSDYDAKARAVLALAEAECAVNPKANEPFAPAGCPYCDCDKTGDCTCKECPDYAGLKAKAKKTGTPFIVFVGQPAFPVEGAIVVRKDDYPAVPAFSVMVGMPKGGELYERAILKGRPTPETIRAQFAVAQAVPNYYYPPPMQTFFQPSFGSFGGGRGSCGPGGCR